MSIMQETSENNLQKVTGGMDAQQRQEEIRRLQVQNGRRVAENVRLVGQVVQNIGANVADKVTNTVKWVRPVIK